MHLGWQQKQEQRLSVEDSLPRLTFYFLKARLDIATWADWRSTLNSALGKSGGLHYTERRRKESCWGGCSRWPCREGRRDAARPTPRIQKESPLLCTTYVFQAMSRRQPEKCLRLLRHGLKSVFSEACFAAVLTTESKAPAPGQVVFVFGGLVQSAQATSLHETPLAGRDISSPKSVSHSSILFDCAEVFRVCSRVGGRTRCFFRPLGGVSATSF